MKKLTSFFIILSLSFTFTGCGQNKNENKETNVQMSDYELLSIEEYNRKAFGEKPALLYSITEYEKLPINKKVLCKVIVPENIEEKQLKSTVEAIISKLSSDDKDIDEIMLWLYSNKEVLNNPYDIGVAIWAPNGKLGNVNKYIAKHNIRDEYKIQYKISKEHLLDVKFGLPEEERKLIYLDLMSAESSAIFKEQKEFDKITSEFKDKYDEIDNNNRLILMKEYEDIQEKYKKLQREEIKKVLKKYNITEKESKEIKEEAMSEGWPFQ